MKKRRADLEAQLAAESKSVASPVTPNKPTARGMSSPSKTPSVPETAHDSENESPNGPAGSMAVPVDLTNPIPSPIRAIPREGWGNGEDHDNYSPPPVSPMEDTCMEDMYPDISLTTSPENQLGEQQAWICDKSCFQLF